MSSTRLHLRLRPAAETKIRSGHPWVFSDSIREISRPGEAGELGVIFDRNNRFLAVGLYDPGSPISLRVLHSGKPVTINADWWRARLKESVDRREGIFNAGTTAARLINGESDHFPGLVLDRYSSVYVLKLYTSAWFPHLTEISAIIQQQLAPGSLILRLSRNIESAAKSKQLHDAMLLGGQPVDAPVKFLENGITFEADVLRGQKTGFFLDQRENRLETGRLAKGKSVLNAFSFSGGFSLYAARGGAHSVTDIDISAHALKNSERNWTLNQRIIKPGCKHELIHADVFEWLQAKHPPIYDLLVLDPPSLAKRESDRPAALAAYTQLLESALRIVKPDATLVCCSCSAHVGAEDFFNLVRRTLHRLARKFTELKTTREPLDHHAEFAEAQYLKAIYIKLENSR